VAQVASKFYAGQDAVIVEDTLHTAITNYGRMDACYPIPGPILLQLSDIIRSNSEICNAGSFVALSNGYNAYDMMIKILGVIIWGSFYIQFSWSQNIEMLTDSCIRC